MCPQELGSIGRNNSILYVGARVRSLNTPFIHLMSRFSSHRATSPKKIIINKIGGNVAIVYDCLD
jgi:hypothetical protein